MSHPAWKRSYARFSATETERIAELSPVASHMEISRELGRSLASVRNKLKRMGRSRTVAETRANHARAYQRGRQ